jgi:hypothetical protein
MSRGFTDRPRIYVEGQQPAPRWLKRLMLVLTLAIIGLLIEAITIGVGR